MMRRERMLSDMTAAPGRFACLECYSSALVCSGSGWLQGGACAALAALLQGACMTTASQLGSGGPVTLSMLLLQSDCSPTIEEGSMEPQLWSISCTAL